jgi:CheY-like chemotaxis protein
MTYPCPATILVVEDEILIRMSSAEMLQDAGFSVIEAGSADDAIVQLEKAEHVELVFSDIDMPDDGKFLPKPYTSAAIISQIRGLLVGQ